MSVQLRSDRALRGTKRRCLACSVPFYDLGRSPIHCPACNEVHMPEDPIVMPLAGVARVMPSRARKPFRQVPPTPVRDADQDDEIHAPQLDKEDAAADVDTGSTEEAANSPEMSILEPEIEGEEVSEILDLEIPDETET